MLPHMPESIHTGIRPEVSLSPFRAFKSAFIKRRGENRPQCSPRGDPHGHEEHGKGLESLLPKMRMVIRTLVLRLLKTA